MINSIKCCGQIQQHHENSLSIVHRLHNVTFDSQQGCLCAVTSIICRYCKTKYIRHSMQEYTMINSIKCCGQIQQHHENSLSIVHRLHNVTFDSQQGCLCAVTSIVHVCRLKVMMQFIIISMLRYTNQKQFAQLFLKEKPYLTLAYSFPNCFYLNLAS